MTDGKKCTSKKRLFFGVATATRRGKRRREKKRKREGKEEKKKKKRKKRARRARRAEKWRPQGAKTQKSRY